MALFTKEELEELARADAELDETFVQTQEERVASRKRDRDAALAAKDPEKRKIAENQRAYYEANREKIAENQRAYREANREKIAENQRAYREANREKYNEYQRNYQRKRRAGENPKSPPGLPAGRMDPGRGLSAGKPNQKKPKEQTRVTAK